MITVLKKYIFILKYILICSVILINTSKSFSQKKELNLNEISLHVKNGIYNNYHPDSIALSKLCRWACVFIKFEVNAKGRIVNLSLSKDTTLFIKKALSKAVYSLENDLKLIEVLKKTNKTILVPFLYAYEEGCNFPKSVNSNFSMSEKERDQLALNYFRNRSEVDHFGETLSNMLNFGNGNLYKSNSHNLNIIDNCILLSPIQVSNVKME